MGTRGRKKESIFSGGGKGGKKVSELFLKGKEREREKGERRGT